MAIDTSLLTDYSWSNIAIAAKQAMMTAAIGGSRLVINGRDIARITIKEATDLYNLAQQMMVDEDPASAGGIALVKIDERV